MSETGQQVKRVLIIDPCNDILESTALLLTHLGYEVRSANSYAMGLKEAGLFKPHVVLLEVDMLDPNVIGSIDRIREKCGAAPVRIVAFTGHTAYWIHVKFRCFGFDGLLRKPAFIVDLIVILAPPLCQTYAL